MACGLWVVWFGLCWVLVLFSTIRLFFPPFNDDLGTMPTRRPYSWKKSSGRRYAPGQADDAANKAKEYQFESLHKIYFYDAWRWKIELNQPESSLHLPPRPGLLQNGCCWRQQHAHPADATESHNTQEGVALAEISSLTPAQREVKKLRPRVRHLSLTAEAKQRHPLLPYCNWQHRRRQWWLSEQ